MRAPALYPLSGIISGLLLARHWPIEPMAPAICAILFACAASAAAKRASRLWILAFLIAALLGAWSYGSLRLTPIPQDKLLKLPTREAEFVLQVERVVTQRGLYNQTSGLARIEEGLPMHRVATRAPIYFRLNLSENSSFELIRGQKIRVKGLLTPLPPKVIEGSFERYLKDIGIHYRLERIDHFQVTDAAPFFKRLCHRLNFRFQHYLSLGAPPESSLSGIYIAMLLGKKSALSQEQKVNFRTTATMHLFAISGLHISVVAAVIAQALLLIRIPKAVTPLIGLPLLYFYVEITGAAPSAVRAFLMVTFFWSSIALSRQRAPLAAVVASAIFVLLVDPEQLWQIGFQLSYLVVLSILLFALPLYQSLTKQYQAFKYLPKDDLGPWRRATAWAVDKTLLMFAVSFAAWLVSAPLGAGFFGYLSPYAVAVNLLLVNLAALTISTGVLALGAAVLSVPALAWFLNHAAWLTIDLMETMVVANLRLPLAVIECTNFPKTLSYLTVWLFVFLLLTANATGRHKLAFWGGPIVISLGLAVGLLQS